MADFVTREPVNIVSGLPRSGTSMLMKMLEAGGVPVLTDRVREADEDNPRGYYEFERVKALPRGDTAWVGEARGRVVKVISALLKHLPEGERYRVVFVRRNMDEILASQRKMLVRRGEPTDRTDDEQMAALFEKHLRGIEAWLAAQPHIETLYVHYSDLLADPVGQAAAINAFFDGTLDAGAMAAVVDPSLYRNRAD